MLFPMPYVLCNAKFWTKPNRQHRPVFKLVCNDPSADPITSYIHFQKVTSRFVGCLGFVPSLVLYVLIAMAVNQKPAESRVISEWTTSSSSFCVSTALQAPLPLHPKIEVTHLFKTLDVIKQYKVAQLTAFKNANPCIWSHCQKLPPPKGCSNAS